MRTKKPLLSLKLFAVFLVSLQVAAKPVQDRISLNLKAVSFVQVIKNIEKQSAYRFYYSDDVIPTTKPVTITVKNATISQVMAIMLEGLAVDWKLMDNNKVVLTANTKTETAAFTVQVSGVVRDEKGDPVEGATVTEKGTSNATVTDSKGTFKLKVAGEQSVLVVTIIGYNSQELTVGSKKDVAIQLKQEAKSLEDVVVIGYGERSKKKLTTSISSIKGDAVNDLPVSTLGDALAGQAAGVQVSSSLGGMPGESPVIRIRGIGSLGADNEPLYVVDGYPLQSESNFASINPSDIESIEILKDAAAASIYGSRGANGVIIVTTKRGKSGKTSFNFSYVTGIQKITKKIDLLTPEQYAEYMPILNKQRGVAGTVLNDSLHQLGTTDWQDAVFDQKPYNEFKLSATGGSEKVKFNISTGYLDQPGVLLGTGAKRYNLRVNLDADLVPKLKIGLNFAPSYIEQDRRPNGGNFNTSIDNEYGVVVPSVIYTALLMSPLVPLKLDDGRYGQPNFLRSNDLFPTNYYNPVAVLEGVKNHNTNFRTLGNAYLEWSPVKNLKFRSSVGGTLDFNRREVYVSAATPSNSSPLASFLQKYPANIYASEASGRAIDWLIENTATYSKTLNGVHNLRLLLVQSAQRYQNTNSVVIGRQGTFTTDQIDNPSAAADHDGSSTYDVFTFSSLAARINYDFRGKYLLDASIRNDGSSKFGANNKYGTFKSISAGWRIGQENFIKEHLKFISELKLTASYGESGNSNIGSFSWQSFVTNSNYSYGSNRQYGTVISGYYNPDLTWEKNHQINLGLQLGLFNDRILFTADAYKKNTTDMILNKQLLSIVGYATAYNKNVGNLENRGLELAVTSKNIDNRSFKWATNFNISFNTNKVIDLGGADNLGYFNAVNGWNNVFLIKVGRPIGDSYGFIVDGILKTQAEAAAYTPYLTAPAKAGDMKLRDVNGDGVISEKDITKIGNALPDYTAGMSNNIQYKNFDLNFVLQAVVGGNIINGTVRNAWGTAGSNLERNFYRNIYTSADSLADVKYPNQASKAPYLFTNTFTTLALEDATFVRLRNLTLGYTFSKKVLKRVKLQSAGVYITGQNLITLTSYPGYNPEVSLNNKSITRPGVDQGVYPQVKNFLVGIKIGF